MIKNYFKIALRNLLKQKGLTFINIIGLSIGFACFILFMSYAVHEFSFDRFHDDVDRMYRVYRWSEDINGSGTQGDAHLPMPLGPALMDDFPDVEEMTRWKRSWEKSFVRVNDHTSRAGLSHADQSIFKLFTFPLIYGDEKTALSDPRNVVLTETAALKYFNEKNPIGKTIEIQYEDEFEPFVVSAIAKDFPSNSSMNFEILGSFEYFAMTAQGKRRAGNWNSSFLNVFVKLRDGSGLASDEKALLRFREKYYPGQENEIREAGNWTGEGPPVTYRLQPMSAVHTETHVSSANVPAIDPKSIWTLLLISTGVLLIAIINFTTLSIGRSSSRSKEVGIRKVIGGSRMQLGVQFLTESVLLSIISVVIGLAIVQIVMPFFSSLSGREMILSYQDFPEIFWLVGLLTLIAGLLAGAYPAFMLSRFKPVGVLKNDLKLGGFNWFTKSLVTSQFVLSAGLVIATIIAWSQLDLMKSQSPGFNKENVIVVDANAIDTDKVYPLFKDALANDPNILGVASSDLGLGANMGWSRSGFDYEGELKQVYEYFVDDDYIGVMGLELLAGRDFNSDRQDGLNLSVIINESMAQDFEWTISDAIGKELLGYNNKGLNPKVVGVVKDFNFRSLKEEVLPQMFHTFEDYAPYKFFIRIRPGDPSLAIDNLQKTWSNLVPAYPLQYSFLDDDVNRFYRAEGRFSKIIGWAGGMSIFLSCLGLLGLVGLASLNRTKEIGIRKVLGASIPNIIGLLSKDFLKLILIALVIASPVTWYLLNSWLKDFAYRIDIQWWVFVFAGFIAIGVALITVGYQSIKAAMANPIDSLRDE